MSASISRAFALVVAVLIAAGGCSSKVAPIPISGTVKLDGKPLAEATVMLWPTTDDPELRGRYAIGTTDAEGRFTVKNGTNADGIEPGRYKVSFSKVVGPDGKVIAAVIKPQEAGVKTTKQVVPEKYLTRETTPEEVEVSAAQKELHFELKSGK